MIWEPGATATDWNSSSASHSSVTIVLLGSVGGEWDGGGLEGTPRWGGGPLTMQDSPASST